MSTEEGQLTQAELEDLHAQLSGELQDSYTARAIAFERTRQEINADLLNVELQLAHFEDE
jgi:hypothetical protein